MAQLIGSNAEFEKFREMDWQDTANWKAEVARFDELCAISDSLPDGQIVGAMLQFPVADGFAAYRVMSEKPLRLEHVAVGDGYQISPAHIRGLRKADVVEKLTAGRRRGRF